MGPEALRVAGIEAALRRLGHAVIDRGNVSGPVNPSQPAVGGYRHLEETAYWCRAVRDAFHHALAADELPVLLGGDHSLAIGSIMAVARHCRAQSRPLTVLWLDAHADFNTPKTTPSGNIHGMPVAVLTGLGPKALTSLDDAVPSVPSDEIVQLGIRSVDPVEKSMVLASDMTVYDMRRVDEMGMQKVMNEIMAKTESKGGHLHVSFDVDFLDPGIAPGVGTTVSGGPTYREAQLCMEIIHDSGLMASLDIVELNPAYDDKNRTAELVVELTESLFGKQILYRRPDTD
jgi:arginase